MIFFAIGFHYFRRQIFSPLSPLPYFFRHAIDYFFPF